jgi:protocatechuate 3,4-dioxygenase beta subunit
VTSDSGNPVRRANVNLIPTMLPAPPSAPAGTQAGTPATMATTTLSVAANGGPVQVPGPNTGRPKSTTTDAQGAFEFTGLPAGTYRLTASAGQYSAAYLGMAYGAKKPGGPGVDLGTPIVLGNGESFDKATIALPRGAVITGRVTDDTGEPLARVQIYTMLFQPGSARGQRNGTSAQTDDLGQYRLFGLPPGEYTVIAEARLNTFVQPNAPPETEEDKIGLMTTYYPGTADPGSAQHLRARAGAETPGIEIRMVSGRLFHITGSVMDSQGRPSARANGSIMNRGPAGAGTMSYGFSTDDQGRFQMRNIAPGNYRIVMRQRPAQMNADGGASDPGEMAAVPLTVGADVDNLLIVTTPGVTITGQVVFDHGPPSPMPSSIRVNASPGSPDEMMVMSPPSVVVSPDLTFTMKGLLGEFLLRGNAPNLYLKAVMIGGEEITDTPREFKTGERVTIVLTSRASTLEGNVSDARGQPATDSGIIVFSEDKASWRSNSLRTRRGGTDPSGHYRILGLLPGRYYVIAVPRERLNAFGSGGDVSIFDELAREATSLVVGEDEQRQADLKVVAPRDGGL